MAALQKAIRKSHSKKALPRKMRTKKRCKEVIHSKKAPHMSDTVNSGSLSAVLLILKADFNA